MRTRSISSAMVTALVALVGCSSSPASIPSTSAVTATSASTASSGSTAVDASATVLLRPVLQCFSAASVTGTTMPPASTEATADPAGSELVTALDGETCQVGPAAADGTVFTADAEALIIQGAWGVEAGLGGGSDGEDAWNALAARCYAGDETCPSHRLAIEVDGAIVSAPTVNAPVFSGSVQITGRFTRTQAEAIADAINTGSGG